MKAIYSFPSPRMMEFFECLVPFKSFLAHLPRRDHMSYWHHLASVRYFLNVNLLLWKPLGQLLPKLGWSIVMASTFRLPKMAAVTINRTWHRGIKHTYRAKKPHFPTKWVVSHMSWILSKHFTFCWFFLFDFFLIYKLGLFWPKIII